jgi:hypothetical protein
MHFCNRPTTTVILLYLESSFMMYLYHMCVRRTTRLQITARGTEIDPLICTSTLCSCNLAGIPTFDDDRRRQGLPSVSLLYYSLS